MNTSAFASDLTRRHLEKVRTFYDTAPPEPNRVSRGYRELLAHYYNLLIPPEANILEIGCGTGGLLGGLRARRKTGVDLSANRIKIAQARLPGANFFVQGGEELSLAEKFDAIVISDTLNYAADVQQLLEKLHTVTDTSTRLLVNFPSALWRPFFTVARWLGLKHPEPQSSWLSTSDVINLMELAGWETLQVQPRLLLPVRLGGVEKFFNRVLAPVLPFFCLTVFVVGRPRRRATPVAPPTLSVVIPARNEAGNIRAAVERTPELGAGTELIFVEGHSRDGTWAEIQRVAADFPHRRIKVLQQTGRGKGNAVREGFAAASGDLLIILDADLTMPPEELPKFYEVLASGRAEFANGVRLVYPMEEHAMQFLNLCANKIFGLLFTWLLGQHVKDTLCGTKALHRAHYEKIVAQRAYFGDFDPFGDFDLLFGAGKLNLKIADVPIRYRERTYGTTNILRWRHGWLLLRMVFFAARKLKFV